MPESLHRPESTPYVVVNSGRWLPKPLRPALVAAATAGQTPTAEGPSETGNVFSWLMNGDSANAVRPLIDIAG